MTKHQPTILLVEDEEGFRRVYRDYLESRGYRVVEAEDGEAGWQLARTANPDLVLLDIVMPKLNGFEVLKRIRDELGAKLPVLILSVLGEQGDREMGMDLGANGYIVKGSVSPREIAEVIEQSLGVPAPLDPNPA